jgi:hypothetical protein
MRRAVIDFAIVAIASSLFACRPDEGRSRPDSAGLRRGEQPVSATTREPQLDRGLASLQPGMLPSVAASPVQDLKGAAGSFEVTTRTETPASAHARRFGTITRPTSLRDRAPNVGQYPCTSCHQGRQLVMRDERIADAHRNIKPEHPRLTGATCSTCHAADNVERLALRSGEYATLDHTYRVCAQCHFAQAESWAAGAHGKRLDGWQGRRVVMGCADCHDPHNPTIEQRIPFRAPRLARSRSGDGH